MPRLVPRQPRIRLDPDAYKAICKEVLSRDSWRCQNCGTAENLQVHHIQPRSKLGHDSLENLITLCVSCHESLHRNLGFSRSEASERKENHGPDAPSAPAPTTRVACEKGNRDCQKK